MFYSLCRYKIVKIRQEIKRLGYGPTYSILTAIFRGWATD